MVDGDRLVSLWFVSRLLYRRLVFDREFYPWRQFHGVGIFDSFSINRSSLCFWRGQGTKDSEERFVYGVGIEKIAKDIKQRYLEVGIAVYYL